MKLYKMRAKLLIGIVVQAAVVVSCHNVEHIASSSEYLIAKVGKKELLVDEVVSALPKGGSESDSIAFVKLYTERWIKRQTKLLEAERLFSSSVGDIESMVEEYRQSLLTRRLDRYYISASDRPLFSDEEIERYYEENSSNLKLSNAIVKGRIMRISKGFLREKKLVEMMKSDTPTSRQDLILTSEKSPECMLEDFGATWVDYSEFMGMLPIVRDENYDSHMLRKGVQTLHSDQYSYYFEITEYREAGDVAPLERVESTIQSILTTARNQEIIREQEQQLYLNAIKEGVVHDYTLKTRNIER